MANATFTPKEYEDFRGYLEQTCGIVLGDNKHYLIASRLGRVMTEYQLSNLGALVTQLRQDRAPKLKVAVIEAMTTNETLWFRDGYPFEVLKNMILPELAKKRVRSPRIWSAACSSGQEPYSISMTIQEYIGSNPGSIGDAQIVATDISPAILNDAKNGVYDNMALARGLSAERKQRFFMPEGNGMRIRPEVGARIRFTNLNLLNNYALMGRFDVIFCRNVLIYFSTESKRDILARMARTLNPGGYLFLGASESITNTSDAFDMVRCSPGVVYRLKA